uniref:Uncharacterized protein n=1 Tax=Anas platyrhynchos TaxID=8839 RepID=A0A8B9TA99_ANAPL
LLLRTRLLHISEAPGAFFWSNKTSKRALPIPLPFSLGVETKQILPDSPISLVTLGLSCCGSTQGPYRGLLVSPSWCLPPLQQLPWVSCSILQQNPAALQHSQPCVLVLIPRAAHFKVLVCIKPAPRSPTCSHHGVETRYGANSTHLCL